MSLADDLLARRLLKGPRCQVWTYLESLLPADRAEFEAALDTTAILHSTIGDYLGEKGVRIANETISRHRRGTCLCRSLTS